MFTAKKWIGLSITVLIVLSSTAFLPQAVGNSLTPQPGGFLSIIDGTFVDSGTGNTFTINIVARESDDSTGSGKATLLVNGPGISLCSAHGPSAEIDFSAGGEDFGGNNPLQDIQCGTSYGMAVAIDGCKATTELHGYSHSDYPFIAYMGSVPVDFSFHKSAQPDTGVVNLKFYTPKGPIKLSGTLNGSITMDTCN